MRGDEVGEAERVGAVAVWLVAPPLLVIGFTVAGQWMREREGGGAQEGLKQGGRQVRPQFFLENLSFGRNPARARGSFFGCFGLVRVSVILVIGG